MSPSVSSCCERAGPRLHGFAANAANDVKGRG